MSVSFYQQPFVLIYHLLVQELEHVSLFLIYQYTIHFLFVGKALAGYKRGRPLPVLPRIRSRLPRGTQEVPRGGVPSQ